MNSVQKHCNVRFPPFAVPLVHDWLAGALGLCDSARRFHSELSPFPLHQVYSDRCRAPANRTIGRTTSACFCNVEIARSASRLSDEDEVLAISLRGHGRGWS